MDFDLSQEQQMLKDSVARFTQDTYDFETRRKIVESERGTSPEIWSQFAELGWLAVPFPEAQGGIEGSAVDLMVLMEEFGRGLVAEPFVANALLFGGLLSHSSNSDSFANELEALIAGNLQGTFAYLERQSRFELFDVTTIAKRKNNGFVLNGEKTVVFNGQNTDKLIVLARTDGNQTDSYGLSLFLVDHDADGVSLTSYQLMDGQRVANVCLNDVVVSEKSVVGDLNQAANLVNKVINRARVGICAEAVGIMEKLYTTTVEYSKIRKQFDVPIGSFQVLQHRMADMFIEYEQAKSLLFRTVCCLDEQANPNSDDLSGEIEENILALKVMVGRTGKKVSAEAIQIHGGMGVTDELDVGHYVKRLMTINTTFGDVDYTQQRFADCLLG